TFSVGKEQAYVFLLRPGDDREALLYAYPLAAKPAEIEVQVRALRKQLTSPKNLAQTVADGRTLFAQLFPPEARPALQAARRLLISPDGPLWEIPFAALVTNDRGVPSYLGTNKAITYTPSLALFAQSRQDTPHWKKGQPAVAVVVGNPIFNRQ